MPVLMKKNTERHHEQRPSVRNTFLSHVKGITDVVEELGNPFFWYKHISLHAWYQSDNARQCNTHHKDCRRYWENTVPDVHFTSGTKTIHCLQCPPFLASNSIMYQTNKSDLTGCLESLIAPPEDFSNVDVKIVDGAALVPILDPKKYQVTVQTFQNYSQVAFLPYVGYMLQDLVCIDVDWDVYRENSLNRDHHLAAFFIRKSTSLPDRITPLLLKDPYKHYH